MIPGARIDFDYEWQDPSSDRSEMLVVDATLSATRASEYPIVTELRAIDHNGQPFSLETPTFAGRPMNDRLGMIVKTLDEVLEDEAQRQWERMYR